MAKGKRRDRRREARWRRIVRRQATSGLGVREFCRDGGLAESAFYYWRRELRRRQAERTAESAEAGRRSGAGDVPAFVPVRVSADGPAGTGGPTGSAGRIEIDLPGGRRVCATAPIDRGALADVLTVLLAVPSAVEGEGLSPAAWMEEARAC